MENERDGGIFYLIFFATPPSKHLLTRKQMSPLLAKRNEWTMEREKEKEKERERGEEKIEKVEDREDPRRRRRSCSFFWVFVFPRCSAESSLATHLSSS